MDRIKKEPAVVLSILAAVVLAVVKTLTGEGVISPDAADTIGKAIDPNQGGWLLPIILGVITRFFVFSPPTVVAVAKEAARTGNPTVTVTPP